MTATAAALVACGDDGPGKLSEEKVYTLKGNGFSVKIPGKPERKVVAARDVGGRGAGHHLHLDGRPRRLSLSVLRVPEKVKADLDAAMKGIATNVKGTLTRPHEDDATRASRRATRVIKNAARRRRQQGHGLRPRDPRQGQVFQLQYATDGAATTAPVFMRFAASLKIELTRVRARERQSASLRFILAQTG